MKTIIEGWTPTELEKSLMDGSFDNKLCESSIQNIPDDLLSVQTLEEAMADLKREVEQWQ